MNRRTGKESKESILEAAIKVFSEKGYSQTTIREVAKEAGISVGGVYIYFKNKEDLYATLLKYLLKDFTDRTKETIKDMRDPADALYAFIAMNLKYARRYKGIIIAEGRGGGFKSCFDVKRRFFKKQRRLIEDIITTGMDSGKFKECNVKTAARVIIGILRGFVFSLLIDSTALYSAGDCSNIILSGLLRRKE
jgi:AcrR family transcriptional regulator